MPKFLVGALAGVLILVSATPGAHASETFPWVSAETLWWYTNPSFESFVGPEDLESAVQLAEAGAGLCTKVYLPSDGALTGLALRVRHNGSQWLQAHWGHGTPAGASIYVGDLPAGDDSWHEMVVDLANGLAAPVLPGDTLSGSAWAMFEGDRVSRVWWNTCMAGADDVPPLLTFPAGNPYAIPYLEGFVAADMVKCSDNKDSTCANIAINIDDSALLASSNQPGTYPVIYSATDSDGNETVATLQVVIDTTIDSTAPVIHLNAPFPLQIWQGATYIDPATCIDDFDIDCLVDVGGDSVDTSEPVGTTFNIEYGASDLSGNEATPVAQVVEIVSPESLNHFPWVPASELWWNTDPSVPAGVNQHVIENHEYEVVAGDAICTRVNFPYDSDPITGIEVRLLVNDGTGVQWVSAHWGMDPATTPPLTSGSQYKGFVPPSDDSWHRMVVALNGGLNDLAGNPVMIGAGDKISGSAWVAHRAAQLTELWWDTCTASEDAIGPEITFPDGNPYRITSTDSIDPTGLYVCHDNVNGACTADINSGVLNTTGGNPEGTYEVIYSATDSHGNQTIATLLVIVDNTPPTLTLLDEDPFYVKLGEAYVDPVPAVACDDDGVDCTAFVTSDAATAVDTGVLGLHTVTYTYQWTPTLPITVTRQVIVRHHQRYEAELAAQLHGGSLTHGARVFTPAEGSVVSHGQLVDFYQNSPSAVEWVIAMPSEAALPDSTYELIIGYTCNCNDGSRLANVVVNGGTTHEQRYDNMAFQSTGRFGAQDHYTAELTVPMVFDLTPGTISIKVGEVNHGPNIDYIELVFDDLHDNQNGTYTSVNEWDDVHPPEITLHGGDGIILNKDDPYSEYGYSCWDDVGGVCTAEYVEGSSPADIAGPGFYDVAYTRTDSGNNTAEVVREVQVIDAPAGLTYGGLTYEFWDMAGVGGVRAHQTYNVNQLYPWWNQPNGTENEEIAADNVSTSDATSGLDVQRMFYPSSIGYYGERLHGYITPRVTGHHRFFISGQKDVELYINYDENANSSPTTGRAFAELSLVAEMADNGSGADYYSQTKYNWSQNAANTSADIYLEAGKAYYFAAITKSTYRGLPDDSFQIAWQEPDLEHAFQTIAAADGDAANIIPHGVLAPYVAGAVDIGPTIHLVSPNPLEHPATVPYEDLAECTDDVDETCSVTVSHWGGLVASNPTVDQYTITLSATDAALNTTTRQRVINVVPYVPPVTGSLLKEDFDINEGSQWLSSLLDHAKYVNNTPDVTGKVTSADAWYGVSDGVRLHGYLIPNTTGLHTFWLAGNGEAKLYLSTTQYPTNEVQIAHDHPGETISDQLTWGPDDSGQEGSAMLTAGQKYYIRVVAKRKGTVSTARVSVAWSEPGGPVTPPADGDASRIIPGSVLLPFAPAPGYTDQPPTIDLVETADPLGAVAGDDYQDPATCDDDIMGGCEITIIDADGMGNVVNGNTIESAAAGTYTITLQTSVDNSGQSTTATRNVNVSSGYAWGGVDIEYWWNVSGSAVSAIESHIAGQPEPNSTTQNYGEADTENRGEGRFGSRIHGYLKAPYTGDYFFYLSCGHNCRLDMDIDGTDPAGVQVIKSQGQTPRIDSNTPSFTGTPGTVVSLSAGDVVYFRALQKAHYGNWRHMAVGWEIKDSGGTVLRALEVIPGADLAPFE